MYNGLWHLFFFLFFFTKDPSLALWSELFFGGGGGLLFFLLFVNWQNAYDIWVTKKSIPLIINLTDNTLSYYSHFYFLHTFILHGIINYTCRLISAPPFKRHLMMSTCPLNAASWRGVRPSSAPVFGFALWCRRYSTISKWFLKMNVKGKNNRPILRMFPLDKILVHEFEYHNII